MDVKQDVSTPRAPAKSRCGAWRKWLATTVAALAVCLGWWTYSARVQARAAAAVLALHGRVGYADEMPFQKPLPGVRWLQDRFGHDFTSSVAQVNLGGRKVRDEDLEFLSDLRGLRAIWLYDTAVGDGAAVQLTDNRRLEELSLRGTRLTDAGLASLAELDRLEFLYLQDTEVSDAGLAHLEHLTSLKRLELEGSRVTAQGASRLSRILPNTCITY